MLLQYISIRFSHKKEASELIKLLGMWWAQNSCDEECAKCTVSVASVTVFAQAICCHWEHITVSRNHQTSHHNPHSQLKVPFSATESSSISRSKYWTSPSNAISCLPCPQTESLIVFQPCSASYVKIL